MLRGRSADEELALRLAGRLHADQLRPLDPPVAITGEREDVALVGRGGQLLLVDAPASVREDELEAVADEVPARPLGARLTEEGGIALDRSQGELAALAGLLVDAAEVAAPGLKHPLEHVGVLPREVWRRPHALVTVAGSRSW